MLLRDFVNHSREALESIYPIPEAKALSGILCTEFLGVQSYTHMVNPDYEIKSKNLARAEDALKRLLDNEPIQYILGSAEFYGKKFNVNSSVLIPRPETETLCRCAIDAAMLIFRGRSAYGQQAVPVRVLDLCTGSGCIAWTIAMNVPDAKVIGLDVSRDALKVAASQPFPIGKGCNPVFVQADIFDDQAVGNALGAEHSFDIVVSNPPYVLVSQKKDMRKNVLDYEPDLALFVEDEASMEFNRKIAEISQKYLDSDGVGIVEINDLLDASAVALFSGFKFRGVEILKDIFGKKRFIKFHK